MEIKRRTPDLEKVFNQNWQANNYKKNGIKNAIDNNKKQFNRMFNIKDKEEQRKEILESHSVDGQVKRLQENMQSTSGFMRKNNFRNNNFK